MPYTFEVISYGPGLKTIVRGLHRGDIKAVSQNLGARLTVESPEQFTIYGCFSGSELDRVFRASGVTFE